MFNSRLSLADRQGVTAKIVDTEILQQQFFYFMWRLIYTIPLSVNFCLLAGVNQQILDCVFYRLFSITLKA